MRALCRIHGWDIRELIPSGLCDAVDAVYVWGKSNKDAYQVTPFDSAQDRNDALVSMRAYAETAGDRGYTIYTKNTVEPHILMWKVTDRRGTKGDDTE